MVISGEAGDDTIEAWNERLVTLTQGYAPRDIWNEDETGLFYRALPERFYLMQRRNVGEEKIKVETHYCIFRKCSRRKGASYRNWQSQITKMFQGVTK